MTSLVDAEIEAYQLARAMSWNYRLVQFEAASLRSILATYDAARAEILAAFQARYATMTDWRATRAEEVLGEVEAMTAGLRQTLSDQFGAMTVTAGTASAAEAAAALSLGGLVSVNAVALSPEQFRQFFLDMPICGHKLTRWVDASFSATVQEQIRQALGVGVIRGEGTRALVKRLENGLGMARNEATTLTRTFVAAANNAARDEVYKANADVVKGWKWHTAGDNHVCLLCLPLHGRKFKMGEGPTMPAHIRCRCVRCPETISWRELGIDIDEFEAEADKWIVRGKANKDGSISVKPVGVGGQNPILRISNHPDADSWWASLSPAEKKATQLGPGRAELLDSGKIKMKDLIDNDYKVRTLKDLQLLQQPSATVGFDNTLKITPSARSSLGIPDSFRPLEETLGGGDRFWDESIKKDYSRLATVGSHTIEINAKDPREVMYFGYAKGNEIIPGFSDKMLKMGDKMVTLEARAVKYGAEIEKRILAYVNTSNAYSDAHIAGDAVKAEKLRIASEKAKEAYEAVLEKNKLNHSRIEALNDKMEKSCLKFTKATKSNAWVDPLPEAKKYVDSIKINVKGAVSSEQEIKESLSGAVSLANGKGSSALSELGYTQPRAYANDVAQFMNVGQGFRQTIFHEYGHFVEFSDVSVKEAARSFVLARAESLELEKLSVLTGDATYDKAGEMAYKDKFIRHYAGKVYSDGCTEIVSMGLEYFNSAHSMVELFRKDKEHFFFTLGAVRI